MSVPPLLPGTTLLVRLQDPTDPAWLDILREMWTLIGPYKYFIAVILVFWLVARRSGPDKDDFDAQAQRVLEEKYRNGEISQKAYEKYRQDISIRPKR